MTRRALFVVPPASAPISGGNRYNEGLLAQLGDDVDRCDFDSLDARVLRDRDVVWVDSLYFDRVPSLRQSLPQATALRLIAHSLPSQLHDASEHPREDGNRPDGQRDDLRTIERATLITLQGALAPSDTMRGWLRERGARCPIWIVEPAVESALVTRANDGPLRALMIANLLPNKGVLPLLRALRDELERHQCEAAFALRIVGAHELDAPYARACVAELAAHKGMQTHVRLIGPLPYAMLAHELGAAHVLLSASRVESYGMAIADARAAGNIVIARRGGHVDMLVAPEAGGTLCDDDREVAKALLHLAHHPAERQRRQAAAESHRLAARTWADVADTFRASCSGAVA